MMPNREVWWFRDRTIENIRIYKVDAADEGGREEDALRWLDRGELERWRDFALPDPKRRFALCRAALRSILCDHLGCENSELSFGDAEKGKPFAMVGGNRVEVGFNVSHSGDYGLIAVGDYDNLGVDIEIRRRRRDLDILVPTVMSLAEQMHFASVTEDGMKHDLFFEFWTVKEAVLKAIGVGMSKFEPSEIEVPREIRDGQQSCLANFPPIGASTWRIEILGTPEYAAALAFIVDDSRK